MFPIIGPQSQPSASQMGKNSSTENQSSGQNISGEESTENDSGDSLSGIKLDLGDSGENGVHRETARFVAEQNIRIEIQQSFSFSRQTVETPLSEEVEIDPDDPEEASARRLARDAEGFLPGLMEENGESEESARDEFQKIVQNAVDRGMDGAREQLDGGMNKDIERIFEKMETALDRFLDVFGPENNDSEGENPLNQLIGDQNEQANQSVQDSQQIPQTMIDLLGSDS